MTQPPIPGPPYPHGAPPRRRQRPRGGWFGVAAVLAIIGALGVVSTVVLSISAFTAVEADVVADGTPVTVAVEPDTDYLIWRHPTDATQCTVTDADGAALQTPGLGTTSYERGSWEGWRTFDPSGPSVDVTCKAGTGDVQIGEKPHVETLVGGVLIGLVLPILLGGTGLLLLLVLTILWFTGERRTPASGPR